MAGSALCPPFDILYKAVLDVGINIPTFRSKFLSLKQTLMDIKPVFADIERLSKALDGLDEEVEMFRKRLMKGEELVRKCSKTKCYDALKKWNYSKDLTKLESSLVKFCQMHGLIQVSRDTKRILVEFKKHGKKLDEIHSMMRNMSLMGSGSSIRLTNSNGSEVPQVPDSVIGFEVPLQEFKLKLLDEKDQVVVLSAPTGCGKTTLEPMVCQEDDIKVMTANLLGGAALRPVFDILFKAVLDVVINITSFRSKFLSLKQTLVDIEPVFTDMERLSKALNGRDKEIEMFKKQLMEGEELVLKCSKTKCYEAMKIWIYSRKLTKLEISLVKFCQMHGLILVCRVSKKILVKVNEHGKKLDEIHLMLRDILLTGSGSGIGLVSGALK